MPRLHLFIILHPFLNLPVFADLRFGQPRQCGGEFSAERLVPADNLRTADAGPKQRFNNLKIHRSPGAEHSRLAARQLVGVLRGYGRAGNQPAFGVFHQIIQQEPGRLLHRLIRLHQKITVLAEPVMLPEMQAQPGSSQRPEGRRHVGILWSRICPDIRIVMRRKPSAAIHDPGCDPSRLPHPLDQIEQRLMAFGQITDFGWPVIHLRIDIDREFAVPGRAEAVIPNALKIRGQGARAAGRDKQIAAILEIGRY
ncbi:hypothetical protein D3C76_329100 [compost metagenome]